MFHSTSVHLEFFQFLKIFLFTITIIACLLTTRHRDRCFHHFAKSSSKYTVACLEFWDGTTTLFACPFLKFRRHSSLMSAVWNLNANFEYKSVNFSVNTSYNISKKGCYNIRLNTPLQIGRCVMPPGGADSVTVTERRGSFPIGWRKNTAN